MICIISFIYGGKGSLKLKILRVICILIVIAALGLYISGIIVNGDAPTDNLLRSALIVLSGVSGFLKTFPKRRALNEYAALYDKELGNAFADDSKKRELLLNAVRCYDEDKYQAAFKILDSLRMDARTRDEHYAVGLFTALCQTDLGLNDAAIATYLDTAQKGAFSSQLYSNLGSRYAAIDNNEKAAEAYMKAINLDEKNPFAHNNLANLLLKAGDYDTALRAATNAAALNPELYQAWTVMAIVYALYGDEQRREHCVKKAVESGQQEKDLRTAIRYYVNLAEMNE